MDVNQQQYTMMRAAYGDNPAAMMAASGGGGGGDDGDGGGGGGFFQDPLAQVGRMVRPVPYIPPARAEIGYYGMQRREGGLIKSWMAMQGLSVPPRSMYGMDYKLEAASDFGERLGGGLVGGGIALGSTVAGSAAAAMVGGGLLASIAPLSIAAAGGAAVSQAVSQRREVSGFLESASYRFVGAGNAMADPRSGRGMSIPARREATEFLRQQEIKDPFLNMDDMTNILKQGVANNMFVGTRDIEDFKKKFKDITESVKLVTKTLNTTLEEGMRTLKDLKTVGVSDPSQVRNVIGMADFTGRAAGRTGAEMMGLGIQGAEMFRGTGISMQVGMQSTMMNLASVRALRDAKLLSDEAVAQGGGEEAMALQQNARGLSFAQSSVGRGLNAAFFNPLSGGFNAGAFMSNAMAGGGSLVGMAGRAAGNLASPAALISYQANQAKLQSDMAKTFGGQGLTIAQDMTTASQALFLSQATGAKREDSMRFMYQQQGLSEPEIEKRLASMKGAGDVLRTSNEAVRQTQNRMLAENAIQNNTIWRAYSTVEKGVKETLDVAAKPLNEVVDNVKEWANKKVDRFLGMEQISLKGVATSTYRPTMKSDEQIADEKKMEASILGGRSIEGIGGERIAEILGDTGLTKKMGIKKIKTTREMAIARGDLILEGEGEGPQDEVTVISKNQLEKVDKFVNNHTSLTEAKKMEQKGELKDVGGRSWGEVMASGDISKIKGEATAAKVIMGKDVSELTVKEKAKLKLEMSKDPEWKKQIEKEDQQVETMGGLKELGQKEDLSKILEDRKKLMEEVGGKTTTDFGKVESYYKFGKFVGGETGKGIGAAIGLYVGTTKGEDISFSDETVALLADRNAVLKDPGLKEEDKKKRAADLYNQAMEKQLSKGGNSQQVAGLVKKVSEDTVLLDRFKKQSDMIDERQRQISSGTLAKVAKAELAEKGVTVEEATKVMETLETVQDSMTDAKTFREKVLAMNKDQQKLLKSTAIGERAFEMATTLGKMEGKTTNEAISILKESKVADKTKLIEKLQTPGAKVSDVQDLAVQQFSKQAAGEGYTVALGGGGKDINTPEGAAGKSLEQQLLINQQTYMAMSALAAKLGVK